MTPFTPEISKILQARNARFGKVITPLFFKTLEKDFIPWKPNEGDGSQYISDDSGMLWLKDLIKDCLLR